MSYVAVGDTKPGAGAKVRDVAPVMGAVCAGGSTKMSGKWKCACIGNGRYACEDGSDWVEAGTNAQLTDLLDAQKRAAGPDWLMIGAVATVALTATVYFLRK